VGIRFYLFLCEIYKRLVFIFYFIYFRIRDDKKKFTGLKKPNPKSQQEFNQTYETTWRLGLSKKVLKCIFWFLHLCLFVCLFKLFIFIIFS
jgi:hypothetical protein